MVIARSYCSQRLVVASLVLDCDCQIERRRRVVGAQPERGAVVALGLGQLARLVQQAAEVDVGVGVAGVERQRLTVSVHGVHRVGLLERSRDPVEIVGGDLAVPWPRR